MAALTEMHFKRQQMHDPFSTSAFNLGRKNKEQARAGQRAELDHILEPGYKSSFNYDDESTSVAGPSRLSSVRTAGGLSALSRRTKEKLNGEDNIHRSGSTASFANGNAAGGAKKSGVYLDSTGRLHDTEYDPFAGVAELSRRRSRRRGAMRGRRNSASSSDTTSSSEESGHGRGARTLSRGSMTDDPDRDREEIRRRLDQERRKLDEVSGYAAARRRSMMSDRASGHYSGRGTPSVRSGYEDTGSLHPSIAPSGMTSITNGRTPRPNQPSPLSPTLSKSSKAQSAVSGGSGASSRAAESQKSVEDSPRKHTETVHSSMPRTQRSASDRTITQKMKDLGQTQDSGNISDDEAEGDDDFHDATDDVNHVEEEGAVEEEQPPPSYDSHQPQPQNGRGAPQPQEPRMEEEGSEPESDESGEETASPLDRDRDVRFHEPQMERITSLQSPTQPSHEPIRRVHSHSQAPSHPKHPRSVSSKGRLERPAGPARTQSHDYERPLYAEVDMVRELPLLKPRPAKQHSQEAAIEVIKTYSREPREPREPREREPREAKEPPPPPKKDKGPTRVTGGFESVPLPKQRVTGFEAPRRPSGAPSGHSVAASHLASSHLAGRAGSIRSGVSSHSDDHERKRRPKPAERPREQLFPETPAQMKRREERERRELRSGKTPAGRLAADSVATSSRSRILPEIEIVDDDDPRIVFPSNGPATHSTARGHTFRAPSLSLSNSHFPGDHSGPTSLRSDHRMADDTSSRSLAYHDSSKAPSAIIEESGGGYLPSRWASGDKALRLTEEEKERYRPREWGGRKGDLGGRPDQWQ